MKPNEAKQVIESFLSDNLEGYSLDQFKTASEIILGSYQIASIRNGNLEAKVTKMLDQIATLRTALQDIEALGLLDLDGTRYGKNILVTQMREKAKQALKETE